MLNRACPGNRAGPWYVWARAWSANERPEARLVGDRTDMTSLAESDPARPPADVERKRKFVRLQIEHLHQARARKGYVSLIVVRRHTDAERAARQGDRSRDLA